MCVLNIENVIKKTLNNLRKSIFETHCRQIGSTKENSYYLFKQQKTKNDLVLLATNLT